MSFDTRFGKVCKTAIQEFKITAQTMISNGNSFSCQCMNIFVPGEDTTVYPEPADLAKWTKTFLITEMKSKPLNPKALEEMAKKGLQPKKQPDDIILVAITPSINQIHIGVSVPDSMKEQLDSAEFLNSALSKYTGFNCEKVDDRYAFANIEHSEALKERDTVLRYFFDELKKRKIYIEEDEDDEVINYLA